MVVQGSLIALLDEALDALGNHPSPLRVRVLSRLAATLALTEAGDRRLAVSQQAMEMARQLGDAATLAVALHARHWALWGQANVHERLAVATEMVQVADTRVRRTWR